MNWDSISKKANKIIFFESKEFMYPVKHKEPGAEKIIRVGSAGSGIFFIDRTRFPMIGSKIK